MILKICGITNEEDANAAVDAGATAIGFNFYTRSPRFIAPERAAGIVTPRGVRRVGVFVNEPRAHVENLARMAELHTVQLHGNETTTEYPEFWPVWKAVRVTGALDLEAYEDCPAEALLIDGPASGQPFDWSVLVERAGGLRIILAGGLDASNVAEAIAIARPWGVDACSRIELSPGKKDHEKMKAFLEAARAALAA